MASLLLIRNAHGCGIGLEHVLVRNAVTIHPAPLADILEMDVPGIRVNFLQVSSHSRTIVRNVEVHLGVHRVSLVTPIPEAPFLKAPTAIRKIAVVGVCN